MKTKKLKRFVCLLLAFVVLLAMPLNTQAHAVALESWVMYAIITGLTAMGITFTVAGGVEAMTNAIQEKVDEYIAVGPHPQFVQTIINGTKLVPSPSGGSDPNGNLLHNLFLSAGAWAMLESFVDWLTSDGGWSGNVEETLSASMFLSSNNNGESFVPIYLTNTELIKSGSGWEHYNIIGTPTLVQEGIELSEGEYQIIWNPTGYSNMYVQMTHITNWSSSISDMWVMSSGKDGFYQVYQFPDGYNISDIVGYSIVFRPSPKDYQFIPVIVFSDNTCLAPSSGAWNYLNGEISNVSQTVEILTPEELEKQFPEVNQGVIMQQLEIGSPEIKEWARQVEELFIETGTIPQPQPQVITDPATQPVPTPAPTTPPIQDVDDLGLPTLGEAVFNKFPFSLPRDLKRIAEILNAEPVTPYWEVDLFAPLADDISFAGDTTLRIDLSEYEALGQISRWASVIGFCIMLIIITKGVIKW